MVDTNETAAPNDLRESGGDSAPIPPFRDDGGGMIMPAFMEAVDEALARGDRPRLERLVEGLHESDVAEIIEILAEGERPAFVHLLGDAFDFTVLTELDETTRLQILSQLPANEVAEGLARLESDDAVYILEDLGEDEKQAILERLPFAMRHRLKKALDYPEESAGRRMQSDFVAMPPFWTVGQVIDNLREEEDLPDQFYQIFVVDPAFRLLGTVALDRLLRTPRRVRISDIMDAEPRTVDAEEDQEAVARTFERYNLIAAAVVDENKRLVGVLTIDDVVDIIEQEAEEDIRRLAGAGDAEMSDPPLYVARSRIPWLLVNTVTAFIASFVIGLFDATIEKMVALAILMPVVTAIGGNAGIQAMTVTVRAISQQAIKKRNVLKVVAREILVALMNGAVVALVVGIVAFVWFGEIDLGVVIAAALLFNVLCAGFFGAVLPMALNRIGVDPAVASSVFLTTLTDVIGFFAFLGLAELWFYQWI